MTRSSFLLARKTTNEWSQNPAAGICSQATKSIDTHDMNPPQSPSSTTGGAPVDLSHPAAPEDGALGEETALHDASATTTPLGNPTGGIPIAKGLIVTSTSTPTSSATIPPSATFLAAAPTNPGEVAGADETANISQQATALVVETAGSSSAELAAAAAATEDAVQETVDAILAAGEEGGSGGGGEAAAPKSGVDATKDRGAVHVFVDDDGSEKLFGSALGLLTRKFIHLIQSSYSGAVDMNESAVALQVPKRRIYDITNVLEGVGLLEKRSKNTVAWKGSELLVGGAMDADAKLQLEQLRQTLTDLQREDALLEQWIVHRSKQILTGTPLHLDDVLTALFPPQQDRDHPNNDSKWVLVDETTGKPRRALLAVHAPKESVAYIPVPSDPTVPARQLYVGTRIGLEHKFPPEPDVDDPWRSTGPTVSSSSDEPPTKKRRQLVTLASAAAVAAAAAASTSSSSKRKAAQGSHSAARPSSADAARLHVYVVPTYYDESDRCVKSTGLRSLVDPTMPPPSNTAPPPAATPTTETASPPPSGTSPSKRSASWDAAESFAHDDEGVAAFLAEAAAADDPGNHPPLD